MVSSDAGRSTTGTSRWQTAVGALGVVVALWVGTEMYDVLYGDIGGPGGGHGPEQTTPVESGDSEIDTDDDGGHAPPEGGWDH